MLGLEIVRSGFHVVLVESCIFISLLVLSVWSRNRVMSGGESGGAR